MTDRLNEIKQLVAESALPNTALQECASDLLALCEQYDQELREADGVVNALIDTLRLQVRMARHFGGDIAVNDGNAEAWGRAVAFLARHRKVQDGN